MRLFEFSDAWFLTSLIMQGDWVNIEQIIMGGDILNHATLSENEIDNALIKFIPLGYVESNAGKFRATAKALELTSCSAYKRAGLFSKVDVILKRLNKKAPASKPNAAYSLK